MTTTDENDKPASDGSPIPVRADLWAYVAGPTGRCLLGYLVFAIAGLALPVVVLEYWALGAYAVGLVAGGVVCIAGSVGYRPATSDELAQIRAGYVWHATSAETAFDVDGGRATLNPKFCHWGSKMWHRRHPFRRRTRAIFVFANRPRPGQLKIHVRARDRATVLRLEGAHITEAFIGQSGAIALPAGYEGPAVVEPTD